MSDLDVDVLVIGTGLGGISTTLFLARQGVQVLNVERREGLSPYPRAAGQNPRTMELLRIGGLAAQIAQASDIRGAQGDFVIRLAESIRGPVLHTFSESFDDMVAATAPCTPAGWAMLSQDRLEPIMKAEAERHGAQFTFATELTAFEQDQDGVTAVLRDANGERRVRAGYLVAGDGNRSRIREALGIGRTGHGTLSHMVGIIFDADLSDVMPDGTTGWYYLRNRHFTGTFGPTDRPERHTFFVEYDPSAGESPEDFTPQRCTELIRIALDHPTLEPELIDRQVWEMAARIADRWRDGRVFLVGDAAKVTPPTGGMSGNAAIADGFDLAWKLAAVIRGNAGPGLLDTYQAERRLAAELVVAESLAIYAERMAPHMKDVWAKSVGYAETLLGFRYRSTAVVTDDDDPANVENPLKPSGRPGFRAPHLWLKRDGRQVSSVELFGDAWVLVAGPDGAVWNSAAEQVAADLEITLRVHRPGDDLVDAEGSLSSLYGIGADGASLVRPDGIVAWRTSALPADPAGVLRQTLQAVLSRL